MKMWFFYQNSQILVMILKKLLGFGRCFSSQVRQQIKWKTNANGVQVFYSEPNFDQNLVFHATVNIKISQLLTALQIKQKQVTYPEGVNPQTDLITFLLERQTPKALEIKHKGESYVLRNRACNQTTKQLIQAIRDQKGIYQHLMQFKKNNMPSYFVERCNYMTRYYMKLQAECFCRVKKVNMNELMSPKLKDDLLNYLNFKNEVNSQEMIEQSTKEEALLRQSIQDTEQRIEDLNRIYLRREAWYKKGAILITAVHLVIFGYAIFFVDWLGWDIVEPLTYTVGVIYTMMGIRFYRKYMLDRSSKSIRDALFKFIMPPETRVALKQTTERLRIQQKQLAKKHQEQRMYKNKLAFRTSLIQCLGNTLN